MGKRFGSTIKICLALFMSVFSTNLMPVMTAHASTFTNHKVTICHATNSQSNPYTINYIDKSSVDEPNNQYLNGHGDHTGPVWYQGIADHSWGDIIPPFTYGNTTYPGQNWDTAGKAIYNNDCEVPPTNVTPIAPTKIDPCGTQNDGFIIPDTAGVVYKVGNTAQTPGFHSTSDWFVTIKARALDGYKIVGNDDWTFWYTNNAPCPIEVTATAPTQNDTCGTRNDTFTIPHTTGVYYKVNGWFVPAGTYPASGTVTITAHDLPGYNLTGTTTWTFNFTDSPCVVNVTPATPTQSDVCGIYSDSYTIPSTTGVVYKVNGNTVSAGTYPTTQSVTITAESAGSPYVLNGQTSWTFNYTNKACDTVTVEDAGVCVNKQTNDGEFTVTTTNGNGIDVYYVVLINNGARYDGAIVPANSAHTFTFSNMAPGTYGIQVIKVTSNSGPLVIPGNFIQQMLAGVPLTSYNFKDAYAGSVTLDACPTPPGQVLGDSTSTGGHILATSTNTPNVLPNTGGSATNPWLTIVAAAIAFLAARAITRKKLLSDQI